VRVNTYRTSQSFFTCRRCWIKPKTKNKNCSSSTENKFTIKRLHQKVIMHLKEDSMSYWTVTAKLQFYKIIQTDVIVRKNIS